MIIFVADTARDQEMLDKFQRAYENLKEIVDRLEDENRKLRQELNEYKKRHPSNIGVKNGKTYDIAVSWDAQPENIIHEMQEKRKPGAQPGHKGLFRIRSRPDRKIRIHLDLHECPECHSHLKRKVSRKRIIENIPLIKPDITEYRMDRLYCSRCHIITKGNVNRCILPDRDEDESREYSIDNDECIRNKDIRRRDTEYTVTAFGFFRRQVFLSLTGNKGCTLKTHGFYIMVC